jgi:hypothetical protein
MDLNNRLKRLLLKSGLKHDEAALYLFILENKGCSIMDASKACGIPKTSAYRAFESLKENSLVKFSANSWKTDLEALPLGILIKRLENDQKNRRRVIHELKVLNSIKKIPLESGLSIPQIETFKGENALEKYIELSELPWHTNLAFGNWEDLNVKGNNFVPIEKNFIQNRIKNGGNALIFITKDGPYTHEITDYDTSENRSSMMVDCANKNPLWVNAFEGNNLVYILNLNEKKELQTTLIDSKPVADFYKEYLYSFMV